jgi:hypothetical protein
LGGGADFAGFLWREIFLAYVDACGLGDAGYVWAIVEDDADVLWYGGDQGGCDFLESDWGDAFGAELD